MKSQYEEKIYKIEIPIFNPSTLAAKAIEQYERFEKKKIDMATAHEDKINHILLNYIRHTVVFNYNKHCKSPSFESDPKEYFYWFKEVNNEIGKKYPFLRRVIGQQISRKRKSIFTESTV